MRPIINFIRKEKKKFLELFLIFITTLVLLFLSRLEARLFSLGEQLSENREFFTTIIYFALININVVLILFLSFLIFRNIAKLVIDRKRGLIGSRLRTKLTVAMVFFALAPTILLFYVSAKFVTTSFDTWFSEKVHLIMEQTKEAGSLIYKQDQKRLTSLARLALQRIYLKESSDILLPEYTLSEFHDLKDFASEYGLTGLRVYNTFGQFLWSSYSKNTSSDGSIFVKEALTSFQNNQQLASYSSVEVLDNHDMVLGSVPIKDPMSGKLLGVVVAEMVFETQIIKDIEGIFEDFSNLRPSAQLIKLSYLILMIVITLLIIFSATWLGLSVSRKIVTPLQNLAEAAKEIALGNYRIHLEQKGDDETGQLILAFNLMAKDLLMHESQKRQSQIQLEKSHQEIAEKKQYMEILLKHVTTGVISVDSEFIVRSINPEACKLLDTNTEVFMGKKIYEALGEMLQEGFWAPIYEKLSLGENYKDQIDLSEFGLEVILTVNAMAIEDDVHTHYGYIIVFDDMRQQVLAQKLVAWREVARRIAHEIKNPITPITLNAERLLRRYEDKFQDEDKKVFKSCMQIILTQALSLKNLVDQFSKFSKIQKLAPTKNNLNEIIEDSIKTFEVSYPEIFFDRKEFYTLPHVYLDKEQMSRVFMNLFTNSIAALKGEPNPRIKIKSFVLSSKNLIKIEISDNGTGIPANLQKRVFEPDFSTKKDGTGLGLSIVSQILGDHKGSMLITDNKPKGTKVLIEIPIVL